MSDFGRQDHWENVYATKDEHAVSWFQERPDISVDLTQATGVDARAVLHFLTDPKDRAAYAKRVLRAVRPGGHVIIGTFALDGPERCSGLPVIRHDAASLGKILGPLFELVESKRHDHHTPAGAIQRFQFSRFRRLN